jgi:regulator of sigma E protease
VVLYVGAERFAYEDKPVVVGVVTANSPAARAGFQPGDHVLAVADRSVKTWEDFYLAVGTHPNRELTIRFERGGTEQTKSVTPEASSKQSRFEIGDIGLQPNVHPHIRLIRAGEAAERAGLKANDVVVAINGETITFGNDLKAAVVKHPEQQISMVIERDGQQMTVLATPGTRDGGGFLGIDIADETVSIKPGLIGAARMSIERNVEYAGLIFQTIWGLITRETSPKQLMGPVAMAQLSGESAQLGIIPLLALMAQISLNLGLLNLLPIPILDGGHIFIMAIEGLFRRDFSIRLKEKMLMAGFVVLLTLMVTVIYNDLTRISWIERLMPWR